MLSLLDRVTNRTAYLVAAAGLTVSLVAAFMAPQEATLGAWVRLVIWHGMLKWAVIVGVFAMGAMAVAYLVKRRDQLFEWARAMQVTLLPLWVIAVFIGAVSAKLIWNGWNLTERRMIMSVAYIVVAAVALMITLMWENRRVGSVAQIVTAFSMLVGLWWISRPGSYDIHPSSAVMSSDDVSFKLFAFAMMGGCLVTVLALTVPVRRWLRGMESGG